MQDNPKAINSKAELAVVLQDLDKEQEAAQLLKQILREPHIHDPGIDFIKDRAPSSGPAAVEDCGVFPWFSCAAISYLVWAKPVRSMLSFCNEDSVMDEKQKFTLHFVMKERAHANTQDTSDIKYEGKIRSGASACWISFPGKFAAGWDALVAELHGDSVACVFLSTPESGLGKHHTFKDGSCYCKDIYGERDFQTFGYLVKMKELDSDKLKREQEKAKLTNAVIVPANATPEMEEMRRQEAKRNWEMNGKRAAWGCQWFHVWNEKAQSSGKT